MLTPDYLDSLPEPVVSLFREAENEILLDMARSLSQLENPEALANWQKWKMEQLAQIRSKSAAELTRTAGLSQKKLQSLFQQAATQSLQADDKIYRAAGLSPGSPNDSPELLQLLNSGAQQTSQHLQYLLQNTSNTAAQQFSRQLDNAWLQISSGASTPQTAIRRAIKQLSGRGLQSFSASNGQSSLEGAVRRAVLTGVGKTTGELGLAHAQEMGCDLMKLTSHAGARPSHMVWQGKIVSLSGKEGYLSKSDIGYGTGEGFKGWNCRHDWLPYYEGISEEADPTSAQEDESQTVTYNGKNLSYYEATQQQRTMQRQIRRWERESRMMEAAGQDTTQARMKLAKWQAAEKDFCKQTGLDKLEKITYNDNILGVQFTELGRLKSKLQADSRMDKTYYYIIKNKFSHASKFAKRAFNKFVPPDSVAITDWPGTAVYDPSIKKIRMNYLYDSQNSRGNGATWFHEHGHLIDDAAGRISDDQTFLDLLTADTFAYTKTYGKKHHLQDWDEIHQAISQDLQDMRKHSAVSDLLGALTKGKISGIAGHDLSYWLVNENITSEAFAHMFEAQFDEIRYEVMKEYFPKSLEYFEKKLREAVT